MDQQTELQPWDPLDIANRSDLEILTAAKKREIKNILKSYVGTYDPMSELIQNAMDAVEKRQDTDESFVPKLDIVINLKENSFQVVDNGTGFDREQFRAFMAPNISFKKEATSRGNKGVGATYIAYGFNELEIRTKNPNFHFSGRFRNGRDWVEDSSGTVHRPQVSPIASAEARFDALNQGTSFKITFGGKNTRPSNLSWYQATTPEQWLYLLLVKTPLGHINIEDGAASLISFDLTVVDAAGVSNVSIDCKAKYKYPHEEIKASQRLSVVIGAQKAAIDAGKDPNRAIEKYRNSNGLFDWFTPAELLAQMRNLTEDEKNNIISHSISAYGYFGYSTAIWDQLNDVKAKLRKNYRILRRPSMANNHMAQGDLITIPLTKSIGHQNQTHVIVHSRELSPTWGERAFQPS